MENWTFNDHEFVKQQRNSATFVAIYCTFILLVLIGNSAVVVLVVVERKLHRPTNYYVTSLCVSDILVAVFVLPMEIMSHYDETFMTSQLCKSLEFFAHASLAANIYGVVTIAADRYRSILHPFSKLSSTKYCLLFIFIVWSLALANAWRGAVLYDVTLHVNDAGGWALQKACAIRGNFVDWVRVLVVYDFLSTYVIPLLIILILYARIFQKIYDRNANFLTDRKRARNARVVRMLVAIVVMFVFCQLPLHAWKLYVFAGPGPFSYYLVWHDICDVVSFTNSWLNVIAYVGFNENFQNAFRERLKRASRNRRTSQSQDVVQINAPRNRSSQSKDALQNNAQQKRSSQSQNAVQINAPRNRSSQSHDALQINRLQNRSSQSQDAFQNNALQNRTSQSQVVVEINALRPPSNHYNKFLS
ncbi:neuropeptide FF receptor 2-like [Tubulanus polymorphus]|uniref:neuropeptide FF receptor 2-like n=1 Tax=Tubulanus polymorphus TaxID=672921 RepID=UPI003DA634CC